MTGIWDGYDGFSSFSPGFVPLVFQNVQEKSEVLQAVHGSNPHVPGTKTAVMGVSQWLDGFCSGKSQERMDCPLGGIPILGNHQWIIWRNEA